MIEFLQDPKTLIYAILGGLLPSLFWLWFWLKQEDREEPEPFGLIVLSFFLGSLLVFLAIWLEKLTLPLNLNPDTEIVVWAAIEEILKFLGIYLLIARNKNVDQPIDYAVYFITVALGFAAFENILYLLGPMSSGTSVGFFTGGLRFLGSTLLHAMSSAMIGSALGLSFFLKRFRKTYLLIGVLLAITLHSVFNFFIMKVSGEDFISIFGFLWVVTIINILVFEKLKRMAKYIIVPN